MRHARHAPAGPSPPAGPWSGTGGTTSSDAGSGPLEFGAGTVHARFFERRSRRVARAKADGETARDLMTSPVVTIGPDEPLAAAARTMELYRVKRLPVVDPLRRHARRHRLAPRPVAPLVSPGRRHKHEIVTDVLRRRMWLDPIEIQVSVADGRVTLSGRPDRRSMAELAARLAARVDGVVAVAAEMTWRHDDLTATQPSYVRPGALRFLYRALATYEDIGHRETEALRAHVAALNADLRPIRS